MRIQIPEEYRINARQITVSQLIAHLSLPRPAVIFNYYAQAYGVEIKDFKYLPKGGFLVDMETRHATHFFECKGIERRDKIISENIYQPLVPEIYREAWFDLKDARRSYAVFISFIHELENPIPVESFPLYESKGNVTPTDELHHPRPVELPRDYHVKIPIFLERQQV